MNVTAPHRRDIAIYLTRIGTIQVYNTINMQSGVFGEALHILPNTGRTSNGATFSP